MSQAVVDILTEVVELDKTTNMSALELVYAVVPMPTDGSDDDRSEDRYEAIEVLHKVALNGGCRKGVVDLSTRIGTQDKEAMLQLALNDAIAENTEE